MKTASISLTTWLDKATPEQREELYRLAKTSYVSLNQTATGFRNMSPKKAAQVEEATIAINAKDKSLPPVLRSSACAVCAECPFAFQ